ncbi:MAG: flavodoxin family protein [Candidatus Bathyarchaeota archaeon]|jgi:multimeric flavodoxin WrbA
MRILAISGSPRKEGNTDRALKTILYEIESVMPEAETEFIRITDYSIGHCRGCRHCMTHIECIIEDDDLDTLIEKMHRVDLVILGAPIYWWSPPGVFKDFIDRTHAFYPNEELFKGKRVAIVTIAAQSGFPSHEKTMSWLEHYGAEYIGSLRLFAREKGELERKPEQLRKIESFAQQLASHMRAAPLEPLK